MELIIDDKAQDLIDTLKSLYGQILFYQSFGCCDGSIPLCYAKKDFTLGSNDICLASSTNGIELWTHQNQADLYKDKTFHLTAEKGIANEYSLEYELGMCFKFL
ncbi:DUF779 domain-containing protein [Helicobacter sp.]|uniref:DUF779 domain-containing protein n=1 Tax=Helicobacter sp. TaxID=218 RepID=UPI0025B8F119|nr:DUF779 domain-containing protein [Helicobacter sp.]MCI5969020.1 DUF779 domain-containing protein [Helicobacter sp.]MDY2584371.1 DUF779 domain-containing protein [Helicobacter sp.]